MTSLLLQTHQAYRLMAAGARPFLADLLLRLLDAQALILADGHEAGVSLQAIRESLGLPPQTMTGIVDRLETRGLVRRSRYETDRRSVRITVTEAGHIVADLARGAVEDVDALVISRTDEREWGAALDLFFRIRRLAPEIAYLQERGEPG